MKNETKYVGAETVAIRTTEGRELCVEVEKYETTIKVPAPMVVRRETIAFRVLARALENNEPAES